MIQHDGTSGSVFGTYPDTWNAPPSDETDAALRETFDSLEPFAHTTETHSVYVHHALPGGKRLDESLSVFCSRETITPAGETEGITTDHLSVAMHRGPRGGPGVSFVQQAGEHSDSRWEREIFGDALARLADLPEIGWLEQAYVHAHNTKEGAPNPDLIEDLLDFSPKPVSEVTTRRLLGRCGSSSLLVGTWSTKNEAAYANDHDITHRFELTELDDSAQTYTERQGGERKLQIRKPLHRLFLDLGHNANNGILGPDPRTAVWVFNSLARRAGSGLDRVVPVNDFYVREYTEALRAAVASGVEPIPFTY